MDLHQKAQERQVTMESFASETSDETNAEVETRLREQLQQLRKRLAITEMEKNEAKARVKELEAQLVKGAPLEVQVLLQQLNQKQMDLREAQRKLKELREIPRPEPALAAEVSRLQAQLAEELALRKTAQYEVIEKSKAICNLQVEAVEKEFTITQLHASLRREERAQQTPAYAFTPPPSRSLARNSTGPIGSASYSGPVSPQRASPSASPCLLEYRALPPTPGTPVFLPSAAVLPLHPNRQSLKRLPGTSSPMSARNQAVISVKSPMARGREALEVTPKRVQLGRAGMTR